MGVHATILFAASDLPIDQLADIIEPHLGSAENAAVLIANEDSGLDFLARKIPHFSVISLWTDEEIDLEEIAQTISRFLKQKIVAITMGDTSCTGYWQLFDNGHVSEQVHANEEDYSTCGIEGIERSFRVSWNEAYDPDFFSCCFLSRHEDTRIRSSTPVLKARNSLTAEMMLSILEDDVPGIDMEFAL